MKGRRAFLAGAGAAGLGGLAAWFRPGTAGVLPPAFAGDALFRDVAAYAEMGAHRTGGPADLATARWLAGRLAESGFRVRAQPFAVRQFFPERVALTVAGRAFEAHPQWPVTRPELAVAGPLREIGRGPVGAPWIALVEFPYDRRARIDLPGYRASLEAARAQGATATVAATPGPTGGIIVMNVPRDASAPPLPTVLARGDDLPALRRAAAQGGTASIEVRGRIAAAARARNLVGVRGSRGPWLVVSTPMSGWTRAAGERGGGVALWRAVAASAARLGDRRTLMVATSGHELAHAGAAALLPALRPLVERHGLDCWFHLGANVATRDWTVEEGRVRLLDRAHEGRHLIASPALLPTLAWCFGGERGLTPAPLLPGLAAGELETLAAHGFAPVAGIFGSSLTHHVALDLPDVATSPALLEAIGRGLWRFLRDRAG